MQGRAETGIEQDDRQRQRADEIGEVGIVEVDAQPVDAGQKADRQEQEQEGGAEAEGEEAGKRGQQDEDGADEDDEVERFEHRRDRQSFSRGLSPRTASGAERRAVGGHRATRPSI